jgi:hypothetical protein
MTFDDKVSISKNHKLFLFNIFLKNLILKVKKVFQPLLNEIIALHSRDELHNDIDYVSQMIVVSRKIGL